MYGEKFLNEFSTVNEVSLDIEDVILKDIKNYNSLLESCTSTRERIALEAKIEVLNETFVSAIKNTILKIIEWIKNMIKKIINFITSFLKKINNKTIGKLISNIRKSFQQIKN